MGARPKKKAKNKNHKTSPTTKNGAHPGDPRRAHCSQSLAPMGRMACTTQKESTKRIQQPKTEHTQETQEGPIVRKAWRQWAGWHARPKKKAKNKNHKTNPTTKNGAHPGDPRRAHCSQSLAPVGRMACTTQKESNKQKSQ